MNPFLTERFDPRREAVTASIASVLAHLGVAALLYAAVSPVDFPRIHNDPRVIHVTWVYPAEAQIPPQTAARRTDDWMTPPYHPQTERKKAAPEPVTPARNETRENSERQASDTVAAAVFTSPSPPDEGKGKSATHSVGPVHGSQADPPASHEKAVVTARPRYGENAPPDYPWSARLKGHEGVVVISAEILAEGRVGHLKIKTTSGHDSLDRSALEAVKQWRFEPARRLGKPITMWVDIPVRYLLTHPY